MNYKVVILAGGFGTRLGEETNLLPKPLVKIGNKPILYHIMNYYSFFGISEFIICCGYKQEKIKEYFLNFAYHTNDITLNLGYSPSKTIPPHNWKIHIVDTGLKSLTGQRLTKIKKYLNKNDDFLMTYGDGLSNININDLIKFHKKHKKIATVSAVFPPPRFGALKINKQKIVTRFNEKGERVGGRINGGFFVLNYKVFNFIKGNQSFELNPLENLSKTSNLYAFEHDGFWHPMDTVRDKNYLNEIFSKNKAPWILNDKTK